MNGPNSTLFPTIFLTGIFLANCSSAEPAPFSPQALAPDFFAESKATFTNPHTNADCLGAENPAPCCTGSGTGTCDQPVESFLVVNCTTRNIDCLGAGNPHACCTGGGSGNCCYEESDSARGFRGNSYCPAAVCGDGCVNQWVEQSGYVSSAIGRPITGHTMEQDDLEKPCYQRQCINGHACLVGHPTWTEPDYPTAEQPTQDATLEIEPTDRTGALAQCPGTFYLAQLVNIAAQSEDHRLLAGFVKYFVDENQLGFQPFSGGSGVSVTGVLPRLDAWYWIELQRNGDTTLTLWVDGEDKTRVPAPTNTTSIPWATQSFCHEKSCEAPDNQEFRGKAALLFYKCGALPSAAERGLFLDYVVETYTASIFLDAFETGDLSAWSLSVP